MPCDLRGALRDALAVSVPPAPTDSIRKRAREITRRNLARSVSGTVAIAVCSLCFWLSVASHAARDGTVFFRSGSAYSTSLGRARNVSNACASSRAWPGS